MEWPYASLRRFRMPPDQRPLAIAEYSFLDRPYANNPAFAKYAKVTSYAGDTFTRNWVVNEKEHPTTGTPYSWVRCSPLRRCSRSLACSRCSSRFARGA